jgi:hypothetical protein
MFPFSGRTKELNLLIIVFILVIIILLVNDYINKKPEIVNEPFQNYYLTGCPSGYKSFYDKTGNIICCDGEVVAGRCIGNKKCTLNGKGKNDMPNCVQAILDDYKQKSKALCPISMSSYFEDLGKKIKGCTNGNLNDTLNAPQDSKQPQCKIYDSLDKNINTKDSCYNIKLLDEAPCFGNNCNKQLIQPTPNKPVLIGIGFTDNIGMYRMSFTKESAERYLNAVWPTWKESGIDLSKNINIAEVAKAYFVDRTMDQSQVQL